MDSHNFHSNDAVPEVKSIMQKEIFEQPAVVKKLFERCINTNDTVMLNLPLNINNIIISASGSSYNCAAIAAPLFRELLCIPCEYEYSSEFILQKNYFVTPETLFIFISQSGETSDTLQAIKKLRNLAEKLCVLPMQKTLHCGI